MTKHCIEYQAVVTELVQRHPIGVTPPPWKRIAEDLPDKTSSQATLIKSFSM
jgi:hypothetical protein